MIGKRFGRLEVVSWAGKDKQRKDKYWCLCDCGNYTVSVSTRLNAGKKKSCGCMVEEHRRNFRGKVKHGDSNSAEYTCWQNIKERCFNPNCGSYAEYGARGITMADEWVNDYGKFLEHVGRRPSDSHSIERIDNEIGYYPGNLRWALLDEQSVNKRWTRWVEWNGEQVKLAELCWDNGWNLDLIRGRLNQGWSLDEAINKPLNKSQRKITINGITKGLHAWLDLLEMNDSTFKYRKSKGMSDYDALTRPKQQGSVLK